MATKYVFVTGGVVSGLGKGITAASLGRLLKTRGLKVASQKLDPYINVDPGTMSPLQHGEVFVTDDGTETDLDLGHYERFIDENLNKYSNLTTGKVYWNVLNKERQGAYLGQTVQIIPHITNEIKSYIYNLAKSTEADVVITEIGGTTGDIESQPFLEAIRQVGIEQGMENCCYIHVVLVPYISGSDEYKSKPAQHSCKELQGMGIAVLTDAGRLSSYVNDIGIMNMAYIVDNYEDGMKLMATDTFKGWDADLANNGICGLCYNYYDGARSFMGHKAYNTPADLKGAVIRTPGADPYVESISAMGATPYNIAWSEVYNGIQTKSIDGCEVQYTSAVSSKIYEVCEYVSKTEHINLFNMVICGQAWFDKLPAEYQEVMKKDFNDCAYNNAQDIIAAQDDMEKTLTDNGMTIVEVDKDIFREAVKPAYEKLGWTELREQLYKEAGVEA